MLTKKEAAEYLGVSPRTLERYVKDGKISVRYKASTNGEIALFDPDELAQLAEDKQTPRILPATMGNELPATTTDTASEKLSGGVVGLLTPFQELIERLILTLSERDPVTAKVTPAMLQGKLLFTLSEARVMTGLSRQILMEAIKEGRLPSQIVGKAYRIKAKDLEQFIDQLW